MYVKVIWRKGFPHAVLFNEESRCKNRGSSHSSKRSEFENYLSSNGASNLETCLTKLHLKQPDGNYTNTKTFYEPSSIPSQCRVTKTDRPSSVPVYDTDRFYYFVECQLDSSVQERPPNCADSPDAFTERIFQWLTSSSTFNLTNSSEFSIDGGKKKEQRETQLKPRPKTSLGIGNGLKTTNLSAIGVQEFGNRVQNSENTVSLLGRPQLHVFLPVCSNREYIFEF